MTIEKGVTRRGVLKAAAAVGGVAVGSGAITGFPTIWAQNIKNVTLRQFGTGVSDVNAIAVKCKEDLGFTLQLTALDSDAVTQRAITQPNSFDIADIEYWICKKVYPRGVLQPMDTKKIKYFDKIVPLFITGKLTPDSVIAQGTAPHTVGFVEGKDSTKFAKSPTEWFTLVPTIYNADTLGIRPDLVGRPIANWKDLADPAFKGKASILNIPSIGIMDAAMMCESLGVIKYGDKGNMTKAEIDKTIATLIDLKKQGQFRAFWKTFDESVNLMVSGEVVIQSMWSPAVAAVRSKGMQCTYQPLKEGYRHGAAGLASPSTSRASSLMPPMSTSTGTCPAGSAPTSTARATTRRCWRRPRRTWSRTSGRSGWKASPPRRTSSAPRARSWKRPARCATAAASMTAWAMSRAGTR